MQFGNLYVRFGTPPEKVQQSPVPIAPVAALTEAQHDKQTEDSLLRSELLTRDEQLSQALIEDPVRFEEMLRNGELDDGVDASDDGDDTE